MPFLDLPESGVRLNWRSNLPNDDVSQLSKSSKPLLILLHPLLLAAKHLDPQFAYPSLTESYNMIALDSIGCGLTECPEYLDKYATIHDTWVNTALLAQFTQHLNLPPFHIFAVQNNSINVALRFSMLFPKQLLSLTLTGVPNASDPEWVSEAYAGLTQAWITAPDLASFEEANGGLAFIYWDETGITEDELDQIIEYWQQNYNPSRCTRILAEATVLQTKLPLRQDELARVCHRTLIIQGDRSEVHPFGNAIQLKDELVNVPDGAQLVKAPGCHDNSSFSTRFSSRTNKLFLSFLASLPPTDHFPSSTACTIDDVDMRRALTEVAELAHDSSIAQKDPTCAWSFSRKPPEIQAMLGTMVLPAWMEMERIGITYLRPDGSVIRKYSERHDDTRFSEAAFNPLSSLPRSSHASSYDQHTLPVAVYDTRLS